MNDLKKTVRQHLKEGAGFLPSLAPTAMIDTDKFLDMTVEEFMKKGIGCHWLLVKGTYEVKSEDN